MAKRPRVAFTFAGEKREFVEKTASYLAEHLGRELVFYDRYHGKQIANPDLGQPLPSQSKQIDLIVSVFSPTYFDDESVRLAWDRLIDSLSTIEDNDRVMLARFERVVPERGTLKGMEFIELDNKSPADFAVLILERLRKIDAASGVVTLPYPTADTLPEPTPYVPGGDASEKGGQRGEKVGAITDAEASPPPSLEYEVRGYGTSEAATLDDALGVRPYAKAVASYLKDPKTSAPLTLSVEAQWGAGKSSFMLMLRQELGAPRTIWFNPWRHDTCDSIGAAFLLAFEEQVRKTCPWHLRPVKAASLALRGCAWSKLWLLVLWIALAIGLWHGRPWLKDQLTAWLTPPASLAGMEGVFLPSPSAPARDTVEKKGTSPPPPTGAQEKEREAWLITRVKDLEQRVAVLGVALSTNLQAASLALAGMLVALFSLLGLWFAIKKAADAFSGTLLGGLQSLFQREDIATRVSFAEKLHKQFSEFLKVYGLHSPRKKKLPSAWWWQPWHWPKALWRGLASLLGKCVWRKEPVTSEKVYVFIDDLDRCAPPKAAELLDSLQLLLNGNHEADADEGPLPLIFVLGMDREKVAAGVAVKHRAVLPFIGEGWPRRHTARRQAGREFGYTYLEKFITVPFTLPSPGRHGTGRLIDVLAPLPKGSPAADASAFHVPAVDPASPPLPRGGVAFGGQPPAPGLPTESVQKALDESPHVRHALKVAAGELDYNPRRIKQYANLLRLRCYVANALGLFNPSGPGHAEAHRDSRLSLYQIAKLTLLEMSRPNLYWRMRANPSLQHIMAAVLGDRPVPDETESELKNFVEKGADFQWIQRWMAGVADPDRKAMSGPLNRSHIATMMELTDPSQPPEDDVALSPLEF